jgi:anti-anti-sigma factor
VQPSPRFDVYAVDGVPVGMVFGEIDLTNVSHFEAMLERLSDAEAPAIVLSLLDLTYMDSSAVQVLSREIDRLATSRQTMHLVLPRYGAGRRLLEFTGIVPFIPAFDRVDEAIAEARAFWPEEEERS